MKRKLCLPGLLCLTAALIVRLAPAAAQSPSCVPRRLGDPVGSGSDSDPQRHRADRRHGVRARHDRRRPVPRSQRSTRAGAGRDQSARTVHRELRPRARLRGTSARTDALPR